ncbi:MAG: YkgJ family cysteine cluster protein [Candidatus Micrarchaeota archaeon]
MGSCLRSGNCCTSFAVCITSFDVSRISKHLNLKPIEFVQIVSAPTERERKEPTVLIEGEYALLVLRWKKKFDCLFYGNGCDIYQYRPFLCRTYPFCFKNNKFIEVKLRACPSCWMPDGKEKEQYLSDLKRYEKEVKKYKKIVKKWNKQGGGNLKEFLEFSFKLSYHS